MGILDLIKRGLKKKDELPKNQLMKSKKSVSQDLVSTIHTDLQNLLLIQNGPMKNYEPDSSSKIYDMGDIVMRISMSTAIEPSAIDTTLPVYHTNDESINKPPYFPNYNQLTDEQRGAYWRMLSNPYDPTIDIGYIFLLFYGLERQLLEGDFQKSFITILKLRKVHHNKSFQNYSANALILTSVLHKKPELIKEFIRTLENEHEYNFNDNLFLLSLYSFELPIRPEDIIRLARTFEFENKNYILKYPELFKEKLIMIMEKNYNAKELYLHDFIKASDLKKVKSDEMRIFANISLDDKIPIPRMIDAFKLKKAMYELLENAHEEVKIELATLRKKGEAPKTSPKETKKNAKTILFFDEKEEKELLKELSKNQKNPVDRHFSYITLQNFYYKYRSLDEKHLKECEKYCVRDIEQLDELQEAYIKNEMKDFKRIKHIYDKKTLAEREQQVQKPFQGNIPAFKRLAIIYDKNKEYEKAIDICNKAIAYYEKYDMSAEEFYQRRSKIEKKMN